MTTVAYLRVSTGRQDTNNQKLAILDYAHRHGIVINEFIEVQASSRRDEGRRRLGEITENRSPGDVIIVSELSRLGRSLGQVIRIADALVKKQVRLIAIKEGIILDGHQDMRTKVMIALFGLFAEVERDLISERTKEGLVAARAKGKLIGRPKGRLGKSKLDGREEEIRILLRKEVSKASIAKICGISRTALYGFIASRRLNAKV